MRIARSIVSHVGEQRGYNWLSYEDENGDTVLIGDDEDIGNAAKAWGMSPKAVKEIHDALKYMASELISAIEKDYLDLYDSAVGKEEE